MMAQPFRLSRLRELWARLPHVMAIEPLLYSFLLYSEVVCNREKGIIWKLERFMIRIDDYVRRVEVT